MPPRRPSGLRGGLPAAATADSRKKKLKTKKKESLLPKDFDINDKNHLKIHNQCRF